MPMPLGSVATKATEGLLHRGHDALHCEVPKKLPRKLTWWLRNGSIASESPSSYIETKFQNMKITFKIIFNYLISKHLWSLLTWWIFWRFNVCGLAPLPPLLADDSLDNMDTVSLKAESLSGDSVLPDSFLPPKMESSLKPREASEDDRLCVLDSWRESFCTSEK